MTLEGSNILIVKYSSLGDIVNAIPAVRFLRQSCPGARIYWLVRKEYSGLLDGSGFLDGAVVYEEAGLSGTRGVVKRLRGLGIDVAVDLQGLFKSGLLAYLSGAKTRVSFPHTREGSHIFYTRRVGLERRGGVHAVLENLSVVEGMLGRKSAGFDFTVPLDGTIRRKVDWILHGAAGEGAAVVVISPTSRWKTKMWGQERFARLSDMLIERRGASVFFTGAAGDKAYIEGIAGRMKNPAKNLAGRTDLKTLAGLFKEAELVVSCDSGAMHLASAMGTPVVAIFGPTDASYTGPFGANSLVISARAPCSPCRRRRCSDLVCMESVLPEAVFEGAMRFLKGKA